jgi:ATP-dependent protease Clp ATPase subunit
MKGTICCSFCGKPQGRISKLVLARKGRSSASICDECLNVCRKILVKSGTEPIADAPKRTPKSYYKIKSQSHEHDLLSCSFCGTSQEKTHRLIGSAPGLPSTYICDKCVDSGDAASKGGDKSSFGNWIARKLGKHETTIHNIR